MPSVDQLRTRLLKKLKELFQLDQPDLDFGFYRIMHAKAGHVSAFIENDLLQIIRDAFGSADDSRKTELQAAYDQAMREALEEYGSPDPENTPKAKKLKAELAAAKDTATAEGDIYDHLYRFFERYYDTGDFISRRYYARETSDKAAPYAVPYNGEEVKLHWANADQYYIKTADHFTHFTFDLKKAKKELTNLFGKTRSFGGPKPTTFSQRFCEQAVVKNIFVCDFFAGSGTTGEAVINLNRAEGRKQKYLLVEMGDHFNSVLKPRIAKVVFSENWKDGKPQPRNQQKNTEDDPGLFSVSSVPSMPSVVNEFNGISHCFKYLRLESYEDTLNNLVFDKNPARSKMIAENSSLREDFMLRYLLDVETRGSQSLLNIDAFSDPTAYTLNVKKPGSDEITPRHIDLIETFNYLIGLRVNHMAVPQTFTAEFKYIEDPEAPKGQKTKLVVDGRLQKTTENTEIQISIPCLPCLPWLKNHGGSVKPKDGSPKTRMTQTTGSS